MQILLVTGRVAEKGVRTQANGLKDVSVLVLPVSVASFLTPKTAAKLLKQYDLNKYDMIILPGTIEGDVTIVEQELGITTFKGPLHYVNIQEVLDSDVKLSKTMPASEVLKSTIEKKANEEILASESDWKKLVDESGFVLGKNRTTLPVSDQLPMRVIAELVNAPLMSQDEIIKRVDYYSSQGANIIDVGMIAGQPKPEVIASIVKVIRGKCDSPISIDTLDVEEIKAAIDADVDLILSVDKGNMDEVAPYVKDQAVVVLPTDMKSGWLPKKASERIYALEQNIAHARSLGLKRIVGDLVVEPLVWPGLLETLCSYRGFKLAHPDIPLLFGIGNATELIDADSPGVNGALTALAREAGACMLHVPEHSVKTRGSVREVSQASKMVYIAEKRMTPPKDIGLDLLILKEKRWKELVYNSNMEKNTKLVKATEDASFVQDVAGWFKIHVDREKKEIIAVHYPASIDKPGTIVKGGTPHVVYQTIIRLNLVSKLEHAAYLGRELESAYLALRTGRSYLQDEELF